jgi:hypothetical protein
MGGVAGQRMLLNIIRIVTLPTFQGPEQELTRTGLGAYLRPSPSIFTEIGPPGTPLIDQDLAKRGDPILNLFLLPEK